MTHSTIASATAREIRKKLPLKMQASKDMTKFLVLRLVAVPFPLNTGDFGRSNRPPQKKEENCEPWPRAHKARSRVPVPNQKATATS